MTANQNPEQISQDRIDAMLLASGWFAQSKKWINLTAGRGVAIREYQTNIGSGGHIPFANRKTVGVIEAKHAEEAVRLTVHEEQTEGYATAKLKRVDFAPLVFAYESTGEVTRFTEYRDPKPRSKLVFTFHRPETFELWLREAITLRARLFDIPALGDGNSSPIGG